MSSSNVKLFTRWNIIIAAVFIVLSAYIYVGFFYPDPVLLKLHWAPRAVILAMKIFIPILVVLKIYFYYAIRAKKIKVGAVVLLSITIIILLALLYPVGDYFYQKALSQKTKEFHSYLQITPAPVPEIDHNAYNIFCLGGSTTEFKDKTGRDWTKMVEEKLLDEIPGRKIKIYNAGRQWYTTQHSLTNFIQNLRECKPDLIIVMHNINDLLHNADFSRFSIGEFRSDYGHFVGPLTNMVNRRSLFDLIINAVSENWYYTEPEKIYTIEFAGIKSFENNLRTLIDLCNAERTKVLLMTEPNIYKESMSADEVDALHMLNTEAIGSGKQWGLETVRNGLLMYNAKIKALASARGTMVIDLDKIVPKSLEYFYDDVHYKDITYDLISDHIAGELKKIKPWKK